MKSVGVDAAMPSSRSGALQLLEIPLDLLRFDTLQPRHVIDPERLEELKESMRVLGRTVQAITVRARADGTYLVASGERRVRAARELGWPTLPAMVIEDRDDLPHQRLLGQVAENAARTALQPIELCEAIARLRDAGLSPADIAAGSGVSLRTAYNYLAVLEHGDLVEGLRKGRPLRVVLSELRQRSRPPSPSQADRRAKVASLRARRQVDALLAIWEELPERERAELRARLERIVTAGDGGRRSTSPFDGASMPSLFDREDPECAS